MKLITVASWEDRSWMGFDRIHSEHKIESSVVFVFSEYKKIALNTLDRMHKIANQNNSDIQMAELSFSKPRNNWLALNSILGDTFKDNESVLVDISTMPRETIWIILDALQSKCSKLDYVYHQPEKYSSDWLSRDPGRPRIVYKLGGISRLGLPCKLVVTTGFDVDRVKQIIHVFEPETTALVLQVGNQFDNLNHNVKKYKDAFRDYTGVSFYEVDAYSPDHGFQLISGIVRNEAVDSNLVLSSLGPKLSAISLFLIHKQFDSTSLAYAPSSEYNSDYSKGISSSIYGEIQF